MRAELLQNTLDHLFTNLNGHSVKIALLTAYVLPFKIALGYVILVEIDVEGCRGMGGGWSTITDPTGVWAERLENLCFGLTIHLNRDPIVITRELCERALPLIRYRMPARRKMLTLIVVVGGAKVVTGTLHTPQA